MVQLAVKAVKVSLNAQFVNSWATNVVEIKIARWQNTIVIDVSTAAFRSAWQWAWEATVRISKVSSVVCVLSVHFLLLSNASNTHIGATYSWCRLRLTLKFYLKLLMNCLFFYLIGLNIKLWHPLSLWCQIACTISSWELTQHFLKGDGCTLLAGL